MPTLAHCPSKWNELPDELVGIILGHLPALDLAIVQQTCRKWYTIAQSRPTLWRNSRSFFERFYNQPDKVERYIVNQQPLQIARFRRKDGRKKFFNGLDTLTKLSKGKLDHILVDFSDFSDNNRTVDSDVFYWPETRIEQIFQIISNSDPMTVWLSNDFAHTDSLKMIDSLLTCSKLKDLKLGRIPALKIPKIIPKGHPFGRCKLQCIDIDTSVMEPWITAENFLSILGEVKHVKLRFWGHVPHPNTLFAFIARIGSKIQTFDLIGRTNVEVYSFFTSTLPLLENVEVYLPELVSLNVTGDVFADRHRAFRLSSSGGSGRRWQSERIQFLQYQLICPKLREVVLNRVYYNHDMVAIGTCVASLKLYEYTGLAAKSILERFSGVKTITIELYNWEDLESYQELSLPDSVTFLNVIVGQKSKREDHLKQFQFEQWVMSYAKMLLIKRETLVGQQHTGSYFCKFEMISTLPQPSSVFEMTKKEWYDMIHICPTASSCA